MSEKHLLLRGSVLRATEWCVGAVAYTGADTKLSLNSKKTPSKLSSVDRIVNKTLLIAITTMLVVCLISMVFSIVWENANDNATYLCLHSDDMSDRYPEGGGCESGSTNSYLTIFTFATLYNNFVCISMYVSLEMVYLCQSYFLSNDLKLYDETTDTPAECHTSGMCADLGQVQYVLSDKTGTLTKNCMVVKQFSIGDKVYGEPVSVGGGGGGESGLEDHSSSSGITPLTASGASAHSRPSINTIFGGGGSNSHNITHNDVLMNTPPSRPESRSHSRQSGENQQQHQQPAGPTFSPANGYTWYPLQAIRNHPLNAKHQQHKQHVSKGTSLCVLFFWLC